MESNGNEGHGAAPDTKKPGASIGANNTPPSTAAKSTKDDAPATTATPTHKADGGANKSPRKRRKVNHGMSCSAVKSCLALGHVPVHAHTQPPSLFLWLYFLPGRQHPGIKPDPAARRLGRRPSCPPRSSKS